MELIAYGEDSLTLWGITRKLQMIFEALRDSSSLSNSKVFYRPSFGRSGGKNSSQFGEFDFIILSEENLYLGESKWDGSSEKIINGVLSLRQEQLLRHRLFKFYVREWLSGEYSNWDNFEYKANEKFKNKFQKPIAPSGSLLASNLETVLEIIREHYKNVPEMRNILLYFHHGVDESELPQSSGNDFEVVAIDYSNSSIDHFVKIQL